MPISQALKERARRSKVRITYTNSFGQRKPRTKAAVVNHINRLGKSKSARKRKSPTKSASQRFQDLQMYVKGNEHLLGAGLGIASGVGSRLIKSRLDKFARTVDEKFLPSNQWVGKQVEDVATGVVGKLIRKRDWLRGKYNYFIQANNGAVQRVKSFFNRTPPDEFYDTEDGI